MKTLAERLREERKAAGLSQKELARRSHTSQTTIADIERGRNQGSKVLPNIAAALGLHALWLKDGKGLKELNAPTAANATDHVAPYASKQAGHVVSLAAPADPLMGELLSFAARLNPTGLARLVERAATLAEQYPKAKANRAR